VMREPMHDVLHDRDREPQHEPQAEYGGQVVVLGEKHRLIIDAVADHGGRGRPGLQLTVTIWRDGKEWRPAASIWLPHESLVRVLRSIGDVASAPGAK
jgi:hypothetical protein